jgi:histidinol phosphatase-like enzyme (inositol monophosphatase family)
VIRAGRGCTGGIRDIQQAFCQYQQKSTQISKNCSFCIVQGPLSWHFATVPAPKGLPMTTHTDRLDAAIDITDRAAAIALGHFRHRLAIDTKADLSPVTLADRETEAAIRADLARRFPGEPVFGEEYGRSGSGADTWIVDPIDGTRSFIVGLPLFGMLLGQVRGGRPWLGVIRMPALGEVYAGVTGHGATCNGTPIRTSACRRLDAARLMINEVDRIAADRPEVLARLLRAGALRRTGADCYPHALVAAGLADAVVDYGLEPYDYLPVAAVVEAAGGVMTDWDGAPLGMGSDGRTVTAATPALHAELIALLNRP